MAKRRATIIESLQNPRMLGGLPCFKDLSTWGRWLVFLRAVYGLPMSTSEEKIFCEHTGRSRYAPLPGGFPEAVAIVGRQAGKDRIGGAIQDHEAISAEPQADGTELYSLNIAQNSRASLRTAFRYATAPFEVVPAFANFVVSKRADAWTLRNGVVVANYPCVPPTIRGVRACVGILTEFGFFRSTENIPVDKEMLRAVRPCLATTGGKLIILSSPYGQFGELWELFRRHYGRDDSDTLVWKATAPQMNPTLSSDYLQRMERDDPEAYRSEVLGEFRAGVSTLLDPEVLQHCVEQDVRERPSLPGIHYAAFADPASGTGKDKFVIAIAHHEPRRDMTVVDAVRAWAPPFNPSGAIAEAADLLKAFRVTEIHGDKYAPGFVAEQFLAHGITYRYSDLDRSQLYLGLLPLVNAQRVALLDVPDLLRELRGLERRRGPSGRDKVDHRPGAHDDLANAVAGVCVRVSHLAALPMLDFIDTRLTPRGADEIQAAADAEFERRKAEGATWLREKIEQGDGVYFPGD